MGLTRENRNEIKEIVTESISALFSDQYLNKIAEKVFEKINESLDTLKLQYEEKIDKLTKQFDEKVDNLEQYTRRNNIRIFGVLEDKNEDLECNLINMFKEKANIGIESIFIDRCHRLGPHQLNKNRPVIIKFISYKYRNMVIKNRKNFAKTGISIVEDLTKKKYQLFKRTSDHFGFRNVWTTDGVIKIKAKDKIHSIRNDEDLKELIKLLE